MKKQSKLGLVRTTIKSLTDRRLARVAGGEDTNLECMYHQIPDTQPTGQATNFPAYCSLVYSDCGCSP